jgi:hypothetical protein
MNKLTNELTEEELYDLIKKINVFKQTYPLVGHLFDDLLSKLNREVKQ